MRRMKRKTVAVMVAIGALVLAGVMGATMAWGQTGGRADVGEVDIVERAAEIVGVDAEDLKSALSQAKTEAMQAKVDAFVTGAVDKEVITADEATEIRSWLSAWPEVSGEIGRYGKFELAELHGGSERSSEKLGWMVTKGLITEQERTAIADWIEDRPEAVGRLLPEKGRFGKEDFCEGMGGGDFGKYGFDDLDED